MGTNLTAANYVFIMDPWWNPAVENQAIDRAYRIGEEKKVTVCKPLIQGSVEEKILQLQDEKTIVDDFLEKERMINSSSTGKLSMKDFEFILDSDLK